MNSILNTRVLRGILVILFCMVLYLFITTFMKRQDQNTYSSVSALPVLVGDFDRASPENIEFRFPLDHGPHEQYQTEWWYYTGNLNDDKGDMYGYQLTFFRRGILPPDEIIERSSAWAANQIYLAHFTLTVVEENEFHYWERMSRGAAGLAGAVGEPSFKVWLYDWQVEQIEQDQYHLSASQDEIGLDLILWDEKGPILQGINGYSQKGPDIGNASYYYSQTRLLSNGTITIEENEIAVEGYSWMDHEFSTSTLSGEQIGWDWFSLQLDDNREIMVYTIRQEDGLIGIE